MRFYKSVLVTARSHWYNPGQNLIAICRCTDDVASLDEIEHAPAKFSKDGASVDIHQSTPSSITALLPLRVGTDKVTLQSLSDLGSYR